jgi:SAM-dependent methyltransferase
MINVELTQQPMSTISPEVAAQARRDNRETVSSYERCADDYAHSTRGEPSPAQSQLFRAFIQRVGRGARVLDVGSGPGWDADRLEAEGIEVQRTDVTQAFIDFQLQRGRRITRLDVIDDDIPGQYKGILCLYVLQHIARPLIDAVLAKLSTALQPCGALLVALRQGSGELREVGASSGVYHVTSWQQNEFIGRLARAGLLTEQSHTFTDADGEWLTLLARKP